MRRIRRRRPYGSFERNIERLLEWLFERHVRSSKRQLGRCASHRDLRLRVGSGAGIRGHRLPRRSFRKCGFLCGRADHRQRHDVDRNPGDAHGARD
jgi:hypothetical protein